MSESATQPTGAARLSTVPRMQNWQAMIVYAEMEQNAAITRLRVQLALKFSS
ncbi:MAG TPA: hypothetical protein VGX95_04470 [Xanthobacteraceae bacterium]|jgi:hypothetical protein|nr:hypothetical protein [Xanthobacteraceae bacterium]